MPSGGRRRPKQGKHYPNRSDMRAQPVRTAPGQDYGMAQMQAQAQGVIPLSATPSPQSAPGAVSTPAAAPGGGGGGPQVTPLTAPTTRPNEPMTAGLSTGPGAGPEALGLPQSNTEDMHISAVLHGMYQAYPSSDLARLIASLDNR